jgi:hypothetical protein
LSNSDEYYKALKIPDRELDFEKSFGIERDDNFVAAGQTVQPSSPSNHNRMFMRRMGKFGPLWKARNVLDTGPGKNILENVFAFRHDYVLGMGRLPNGAPLWVAFANENSQTNGERIGEIDPIAEIDPKKHGGTAAPMVPISCIGCHEQFMHPIKDAVRNGALVSSISELERIRRHFIPQDELNELIGSDKRELVEIYGTREPIGPTVLRYNRTVNLQKAALDVGTTPDRLAQLIRSNKKLLGMGMGPLLNGTVARLTWHGAPVKLVTQLLEKEE